MNKHFKSSNHYTIFGWMIDKLQLKDADLIIYAIVYGFSQAGEGEFYGGRKYMAEASARSLPTVDRILVKLEKAGLIKKMERQNDGVSHCRYTVFSDGDGEGTFDPEKQNHDNNTPYHDDNTPTYHDNNTPYHDDNTLPINKDNINNKKENKKEIIKNPDLFESDSPEYKHNKWFAENFPELAKNKRPLKYKTFVALQAKYTKDAIIMKLNEMESKSKFNRDYSDVGRVLWVWLERDAKKEQRPVKRQNNG